jgi:modulator of FtsH protease
MNELELDIARSQESGIAVNKVLKNTYLLLAMTLAFSAVTAALSFNATPMSPWVFLIAAYGLLFATHALAKTSWGILTTFGFAGFIGYGIGPLMGYLLSSQSGSEVVMTALGGTAFIFFGLSGWVLLSRRDFSFLRGFIAAGCLVLIAAIIISLIWQMPALQLAMSVAFMFFSSAVILYQTSEIIRGGERNYILATIALYLSIYNIFMSLIHLLTSLSGND